jgi:hypothetical protein
MGTSRSHTAVQRLIRLEGTAEFVGVRQSHMTCTADVPAQRKPGGNMGRVPLLLSSSYAAFTSSTIPIERC